MSGRTLIDADSSPMYFERGQGAHIWDVDGHEYIDYLMAFGTCLLGYAHPEVERAAYEQAQRGRMLSMNHPLHVELIERLLPLFPDADMGAFFRTGSEATTAALRVARRCTGRRLVARCGYHGWHDWCLPLEDFVPTYLDRQVVEFVARDPITLQHVLDTHPGRFAAVIVAPEMVTPYDADTLHDLARISRAHGALFIMDEVKTALRVAPGSIAARAGVVPDLLTLSKALANGFALSALVGRRHVMEAAAGMHYSASFHGETAPMAAALVVLRCIRDQDVPNHIARLGTQLIGGINDLARSHDVHARAYGEPLPAMPFIAFEHPDPAHNARWSRAFYAEVLRRGVLLHPRHMWFLSAAHTDRDIARTLDVIDVALRGLRA